MSPCFHRRFPESEGLRDDMSAHDINQLAKPSVALPASDQPGVLSTGELSPLESLAQRLRLPYVPNIAGVAPSAEFVQRVPIRFARQFGVMGLATEDIALAVAVSDIRGVRQLDVVSRFLRRLVIAWVVPAEQIRAALNRAYEQRTGQTQKVLAAFDRDELLRELGALEAREDLLEVEGRAPVIKLVNHLLTEAVTGLASDIHIQPYEERLMVRTRIDGVLFDSLEIPKPLQEEVISRVKVMGRMNIAEKRLPQDGRATVQVGDRLIDLRIASMPTSHGERVVIRLLDKSARLYKLGELGMRAAVLDRFREVIHFEHGLVLVTGPTGSGKSTTLYAALQELNAKERNVLTLEDPIEYQLDGVSQTQINTKKGMTFASGLRSVLRQDPDIIMVGEIRDHETAVMAIQSALTGHLVFSTLHTNDAASAVTRLLDLGIEPYLVSSCLLGVLAQRLVRGLCSECKAATKPGAAELLQLGIADDEADSGQLPRELYVGRGCGHCRNTGYRGRFGIFELLVVNEAVRAEIQSRASASQLRNKSLEAGMQLLRHDGIARVLEGRTSVEEVARVTLRSSM